MITTQICKKLSLPCVHHQDILVHREQRYISTHS